MAEAEKEELETSDPEEQQEVSEESQVEDAAEAEALKEAEEEKPLPDVPYERFKEVNERAKRAAELESKLDQFRRLGPEGYYKLYPDERPEEAVEPETPTSLKDLVVTGGEFDGMRLADLMKQDPVAGLELVRKYEREELEAEQKAEREQEQRYHEIDQIANLINSDQGNTRPLTQRQLEEIRQGGGDIGRQIQGILDYMEKEGDIFSVRKAYALMMIDQGKSQSLKTLATALNDDLPSISSRKTAPEQGAGYNQFLSMSATQVADVLENYTDNEQEEFLKKAPAAVRKKFPQLPWD